MALQYSTPGVYIEELDAFPHSIVAVPTAIPAFIGYTEKATDENGKPLANIPYMIESQSEYEIYFGKGFKTVFPITATGDIDTSQNATPITRYYLYDSIRLFYANGGGECYIVSIGNYTAPAAAPAAGAAPVAPVDPVAVLTAPLDVNTGSLLKVEDATMIVIPDAVALTEPQAYNQVYTAVLAHCNFMQSRVGIFDLKLPTDITDNGLRTTIGNFRSNIGVNYLNYGNAYFPWLECGIVPSGEIDFTNLNIAPGALAQTFTDGNVAAIFGNFTKSIADANANVAAATAALTKANAAKPPVPTDIANATTAISQANSNLTATTTSANRALQLALTASSATYKSLMDKITRALNELPPSGAMAGVYTSIDNSRGVWKAPANVSLNSVTKPSVDFNRNMTDNLNIDVITGKSVNAIRSFPGIGTLVFGGRTLDGNSQDWRYINVRRTLIMMEQSIKLALRAYVFEPNDDNTWVTITSMIANFLTNLWKSGALAGLKPEDAFQVMCGLGVTMTAQDILDGYLRVTVKVAVVHPAEFIVLTFQQKLQTS